MKPDRFLATVLFTDIVGSTERAAELGDRRWRELLNAHHALARREIERHRGRELNMTGDGFLATFDTPERALRAACAIRDQVRRLGLEIRSGLHTGEVEVMGKTVGGIGVHIGARVGALAAPGEILLSSTVRDLAAGAGFDFEESGTHALKGVPGEWKLYAVASEPVRLPVADFWTRAREARLPRMLLLYLVASAGVLWLTAFLSDRFQLPGWMLPGAIVLLLIGLVMLSATAWVQTHPLTAGRAAREEVPDSWELNLKELTRSVGRGRLPHLTWSRSILGGVMAFSLLFGLAGLYVVIQDRGRTFTPSEALATAAAPGLAVLPFEVRGEGLDVWREGMVDLLSTNLDGAAGLRAIDSRTVLARWRERTRDEDSPDLRAMVDVARAAGARYALVGSAVSIGPRVRLAADVYEVEDGGNLGHAQVEGAPDSVLVLVDRLSIEVLTAVLQEGEGDLPALSLARVTTASVPALKAFLEGERFFRRADFSRAIPLYKRAVAADSTFALAFMRLGNAYGWSEGIASGTLAEYGDRAVALIERLPGRDAALVRAAQAFQQGRLVALDLLRNLVEKYPDDPEVWYLLGDAFWHLGPQALVERVEAERAFQHVLQLDPKFAPAYIHLVEDAFYAADSARAATLMEQYAQLAGGSEMDRGHRLVFELAFGRTLEERDASANLDTIPTRLLDRAGHFLDGAPLLQRQATVLNILSQRADLRDHDERAHNILHQITNARARCRIREATTYLADPDFDDDLAAHVLYGFVRIGVPVVSSEVLERAFSPGPPDSTPNLAVFYRGAYAADAGRWEDHAVAVDRIRIFSRRFLTEGDSANAAKTEGMARALEGYELFKRGQVQQGLSLMEDARREVTGYDVRTFGINATIRWMLGKAMLQENRLKEAERYFESFWRDPHAALQLAGIRERLQRANDARSAYQKFLTACKDPDPEFRPMVEEARQAMNRLTSVIRE